SELRPSRDRSAGVTCRAEDVLVGLSAPSSRLRNNGRWRTEPLARRGPSVAKSDRAGVAKLADARDSKSRSVHPECGFDPHLRHQSYLDLRDRSESADSALEPDCSPGCRFACGFLPTPPRSDAVAVRLTVPMIRVRRGLPPPSHRALPGAQ